MRASMVVVAVAVAAQSVHAQTASIPSALQAVRGAQVTMSVDGKQLGGELLAASADSVWLLDGAVARAVPISSASRVRVDNGGRGSGYAMTRSLLFGLGTGVALAVACSTVADSQNCAIPIAFSVGASALIGLIAGASLDGSKHHTVSGPNAGDLQRWARFPQGLPAAFPRSQMVSAR